MSKSNEEFDFITDCEGEQYIEVWAIEQVSSLLGDGVCDYNDGWSLNFNCEEFNNDGGEKMNTQILNMMRIDL